MYRFFACLLITAVTMQISGCIVTTDNRHSSAVDPDKIFDAHLNLGMAYLKSNNREASRRHFEKALRLDPHSASVHRGLGLLYQLTGESALAEASFLKAIKQDKKNTQTQISYGRFLYEQSRYQEAYPLFKAATKDLFSPQRALTLTYLGQTTWQLGNKQEAKAVFKQAIDINNTLALAMIELSDIYYHEGDYATAQQYLQQHVALAGRSARSLWLGVRIERILGGKDKEASYLLALKNLYPHSQEYVEYQREHQRRHQVK